VEIERVKGGQMNSSPVEKAVCPILKAPITTSVNRIRIWVPDNVTKRRQDKIGSKKLRLRRCKPLLSHEMGA